MKEFKVFKCYEYKEYYEQLEKLLTEGWEIQRADRVNEHTLLYVLERNK